MHAGSSRATLARTLHDHWNSAEKKGYSGTAIFTKHRPLKVTPHLSIAEHDKEGQCSPPSMMTFSRQCLRAQLQARTHAPAYRQQWDKDFLKFSNSSKRKNRSSGAAT